MKYAIDKSALKYMFDEFLRKYDFKAWENFLEMFKAGEIFSDRETYRQLTQELINHEDLKWIDENKTHFRQLTEKEAQVLGEMMNRGAFDWLKQDSRIEQRRLPEGLPFLIAMAKARGKDVTLVYRGNGNPLTEKIISICNKECINHIELEEMLDAIKPNN